MFARSLQVFLGVMCSQDGNKVSRVPGSGFRVETVAVWASHAAAERLFEAQLSRCWLPERLSV